MRWPYENIGVTTTRAFRNLLNKIHGDIADDMQEHKDRADNIQAQVDNLVANGDSSPEAAQARVGADGTNYTTLKQRLDTENQSVTAQLAETKNLLDLKTKKTFAFEERIGMQITDDIQNLIQNATDDHPILSEFQSFGIKFAKVKFDWLSLETTKGTYDFSGVDNLINKLLKYNFTPLVFLYLDSNILTSSLGYTTDQIPQAFASFCGAAAEHFSGNGIVWEILNEPNNDSTFYVTPAKNQGSLYGQIAIAATKAIKLADPTSFVIAGSIAAGDSYNYDWSLANEWGKFLEDACKSGFLDYIDGLSFHPYRINSYPENLVNWQWSIVKSILGKYAKREIPLFVTENGYSTATQRTQSNGLPILWTEDDQAALLCRILLIGDMLNFPINTIYEWKDRSDDLTDVESSFGIVHSDLTTKKPAYDAIKTLIRELSGYTFAERVMGIGTANDYILKYFNGTKVKYVYWTTLKEDDNHTIIIERNQLTCGFTPKIFESSQPYSKSAKTADIESNGLIHQMNWYGLNQVSRKFEAAHQVSLGTGTSRGDIKDNGLFYGKQMTGMPVSDGIISPPDNMFFKQLSSIYTINALMQIGYDNWSGNIYSRGWADLGTGYAWTNWKRMLTTDDIHLNAEQTINLSNGAKIYLIVIPIFWRKMIFGSFSIPSANVTATLMNLGNLDASLAPNRFSAIPVFMDRISDGNKPQCVLNLHSSADSGKIELMLSSIAVLSGNINGNFMYLK